MSGSQKKGAYSDNFAYEPTITRERTVASAVAIGLSLSLVILSSFSHMVVTRLAGFIPAVESLVVVSAAFTSWMLFAQYRIRHHSPLAILACGYGLFAVMHGIYLATFPGVFLTNGAFGAGWQTAPWLFILARLGFAALVVTFVFVERSNRRSARWHAGIVARTCAATLGALTLMVLVAVTGHRWLPLLVNGNGTFTGLETGVVAPISAAVMIGASIAIIMVCGVSRRVHLWLSVVMLAMGLEVFAAVWFGGRRFSVGWYVAHADSALSTMLFFCVMQAQLAAILRRAARNGERALALHDIVSLGNESSADRNAAMLERAALDLDFDWACLAQIDQGWVTLEHSRGESPYPENYRAPAGAAWYRDAVKRRDIKIADIDGDVPWIDETPEVFSGWSTFVTVPVFVDDALYGFACFANSEKRRAPLSDPDKQFLHLLGSLAGVTIERVRQRKQLNTLAYSDALTGLPNRASLFEQLQREVATSQRYDRQFALHFLDLDGFKKVNDTFGHAAGDEVLREVARRLKACVRESDTVARLGGDEFVVLQPHIEDSKAPDRLAARLRNAFVAPIPYSGEQFQIGTSIGTSRFPGDGLEIHALLDRADEALYRMKARRRKDSGPLPAVALVKRR